MNAGDAADDAHGTDDVIGADDISDENDVDDESDVSAPGGIAATAAQVVRVLTQQGRTVAVAESLTGGLVVASLVAVPGASKAVRGGVVAYMTDLKASLLDVDPDLLAREGAVSEDVAAAMAAGAAGRLGADVGVATTGVAGPDPQDGRPVGEVWVAVHVVGGPALTLGLELDPALGREGIRHAAVAEALDALLDVLGD